MLVGHAEKYLKQIIQIELNRVKNPNWPEASQLAIYKRDQGFELGTSYREGERRGHEGERNNCFSKIQLVGQKYRGKTT